MRMLLPVLFATIAAIGNAVFAYGQRQSSGATNGLLVVAGGAFIAGTLALVAAPWIAPVSWNAVARQGQTILLSGLGLFITYVGFNLLYGRFGTAHYVLYAAISIITTTVIVGAFILKEHLNGFHVSAIFTALLTILLFSLGQTRNL